MTAVKPIDVDLELSRPFQRLSLAIPIDAKRYFIMCRFFSIILNVDSSSFEDGPAKVSELAKKEPVELLPNVAFPADIWLRDDVAIKDARVKTTMLLEINSWLEQELTGATAEMNEEATLSYYEKLLRAYNFYEMPQRASLALMPDTVLREEDEDNAKATPPPQIQRPVLAPRPTLAPNGTTKRVLVLLREIINSRKRFLTLLGGHQEPPNGTQHRILLVGLQQSEVGDEDKQNFNNLLAKSKIYTKLKKNRELGLLILLLATASLYLNRSSVGTLHSQLLHGLRRRLLLMGGFEDPRGLMTLILPEQKRENRKAKCEYYIQLTKLFAVADTILKTLTETTDPKMSNTKLVRFLEFIKKKVFRFIIVDICLLVMDYGQARAATGA